MSSDPADRDKPSAMPFLLALVVVVIAITAILVINMGGGDEDAEQIVRT